MTISYIFFSLLLGIRHGLDPDHIAIINGINLNEHSKGKSKIWSGFYFSLGHGVTVTFIGAFIIALSSNLKTYSRISAFTEWIPIVMLLFTGVYGIFAIYKEIISGKSNHSHKKIASLIYQSKSQSLKLFITGIFFALVFDTSTQLAAWGLVGEGLSKDNQYWAAILIGLFFTVGMMVTDTLNGLFFYQILNSNASKFNLKIFLSLIVVITAIVLGTIQLLEKLGLPIEIPDSFKLIWGGGIMALSLGGILINYFQIKNHK